MTLLGAVQLLLPVAVVIGFVFFFEDVTPSVARYLVTGTPILILLTMGMRVVPIMVANGRIQGTYDFMLSLPVPRMVLLASDVTIYFLLTLPGIIIALITGSIYHDFSLQVNWLVIPSFVLISLTGSFIGYAIALAVPRPQMANIASQVLLFTIVFFSPVIYPTEQLPGWLAIVHKILPIQYMANLSRGTLTDIDVDLGLAFTVTVVWCIAAFTLCYFVMKKRG
jgi:ABC-2 type transport system permease protein